jgi:hypothetical protein
MLCSTICSSVLFRLSSRILNILWLCRSPVVFDRHHFSELSLKLRAVSSGHFNQKASRGGYTTCEPIWKDNPEATTHISASAPKMSLLQANLLGGGAPHVKTPRRRKRSNPKSGGHQIPGELHTQTSSHLVRPRRKTCP